jgi:hypothetical protein
VRGAEGGFDLGCGGPTRKDESQVARSFRQRLQLLAPFGRDHDVLDAFDGAGAFESRNVLVDAGARNGDHHHPAGLAVQAVTGNVLSQCVPENQLLERYSTREPQSAGA